MESPHHRRIDLQSPSDLLYLQHNIQCAAAAKLDLAFPPTAAPEKGEEDALRVKVEALVQEVGFPPPTTLPFFVVKAQRTYICDR